MRVPLVLLGGIVVLSVAVARALSCVCSPLECDSLTDDDCPGGLTWDPCKCCKVCARVEGEPCGGLFGFSGRCAVGLQCLIKNLVPHPRDSAVDEGICTKIPGRTRRHCPYGPKLSEPGCNLVGEGAAAGETVSGSGQDVGRCVCGHPVLWCPEEPQPYMYKTRHECELNLAAKMAYDGLYETAETPTDNAAESAASGCPEDSIVGVDGECKCLSPCPKPDCHPGQQPVQVREASPERPGSCCPLYECHNQATLSYMSEDPITNHRAASPGDCDDKDTGQMYSDGEHWRGPTDPCISCFCRNGEISCTAPACRSCPNPLPREPGECCGRCPPPPQGSCPSLRGCELECENGMEKDEKGCEMCQCRMTVQLNENEVDRGDESDTCPPLNCDLECKHGLLLDKNGCRVCQCRPAGCPANIICEHDCPLGYRTNKRGCPTCRCRGSCLDERNVTRPEGTSWRSEPCRSCLCELNGQISCNETVCSVACSDPVPPPPGQCCPVCPASDDSRGWGTTPIVIIVALALLCVLLTVRLVRGRFRARLVPSEADFAGFSHHHQQYYKCVPVYETHVPVLRHAEKIAPL